MGLSVRKYIFENHLGPIGKCVFAEMGMLRYKSSAIPQHPLLLQNSVTLPLFATCLLN